MLCNLCKKRKATVHLTEIINDDMTELHLCEECAKDKNAEMEQHFSIADLLSGLVDFPVDTAARKEHIKVKCSSCGMSYSDFKKLGRLGCAHCYEAFKRALYPLLKQIHGTAAHTGRKPEKIVVPLKKVKSAGASKPAEKSPRQEIEELKERLAKAIEKEEFEEAAVLRDRIRELEGKLK